MITLPADPIAAYLTAYFRDFLISERNLSPNTIASYRDAIKLFLVFARVESGKPCSALTFQDIDGACVRRFLASLEVDRGNSIRSRNQRLAALRSFFDYVAGREPQLAEVCRSVASICLKKGPQTEMDYLERDELDTVLAEVDRRRPVGARDFAMLQFMYNSGARVQEVADLQMPWLTLSKPYRVSVLGKGNKWRTCPLWTVTGDAIKAYLAIRPKSQTDERVFLNRFGAPIGRHGIFDMVKKYVTLATLKMPRLSKKTISPHTFRHTTAMHLLQSGVELNVIKSWLGHSSIETTNLYAQIDLEMKTRAMERCQANRVPEANVQKTPSWKASPDILAWLESL